MTPEELE